MNYETKKRLYNEAHELLDKAQHILEYARKRHEESVRATV